MPESKPPFVNSAFWIWSAEGSHSVPAPEAASPSQYQVRYFRRSFTLGGRAARLVVAVSADSRFLFYCNGQLVGRGPAKGDVNHQFYDTYDLSPHLREGANVLAALVLDMSHVAHRPALLGPPCSVMTYTGGLVVEGQVMAADGTAGEDLSTGEAWKVAVDRAYRFQNDGTRFEGYLGYFEHRCGGLIPAGWNRPDFKETSEWKPAHVLYRAELFVNRRDPTSPYGLVARTIPQLEEAPATRFKDIFHPGGGTIGGEWNRLIQGQGEVTVPAGQTVEVIVDVGELTTGYPRLDLRSGGGAHFRLTYAEALRLPWETPGAVLLGHRQPLANLASHFADESTGWTFDRRGKISGWSDTWEPGEAPETFEPLHWRAFRYIGITVTAGSQPVVVRGLDFRFSAYPMKIGAKFTCSDPMLDQIFATSLWTLRLCAHETFEDCPHYEQMQYAGDTMITSKLTMWCAGDDRLPKQSLHHFDWSRLSDGLTQSRYPSRLVQVIPSWSLHWITTARDHLLWSGDRETTRSLMPGMRAVMDWFRRHTNADGLPAALPFWNITDWCPWWPRGVVPGAGEGPTTIIAAQYITALEEMAWMSRELGGTAEPAAWEAEAADLRGKLHRLTWSETEGLYFDRPGGPEVSQYGNAWAIAAKIAGPRERARIMQRFPNDPKLAPGSFFWLHTGFTAMALSGTYDDMPAQLGPWRYGVERGLSTFVEENSYWRSLCHAWSAHPAVEFLTRVIGVRPTAAGFVEAEVAPHRCGLEHAEGTVCTPLGPINVAWRSAGSQFSLSIDSPAGIRLTVKIPGAQPRHHSGGKFAETFEWSQAS